LARSSPESNLQLAGFFVASFVCIVMPLELSQLTFALVGALTYAILQALLPRTGKTKCQRAAERDLCDDRKGKHLYTKGAPNRQRNTRDTRVATPHAAATTRPEVYQPSSVPVRAPKFESVGFDAEVNELVHQLAPSDEENAGVESLVRYVKDILHTVLPEVDVTGFAHGSLKRGTAFGVAVPEVDIVASASPSMLAQSMRLRTRNGRPQNIDARKLLKSAIRACTDQLVSSGGLKFRRSAFRGDEPRVTLLVTPQLGFFPDAIPVDFSVNSVTPFYTAALLTESGKLESRAKALILFVKRWAKDRGICHAAKGHLSPYMWSLLVMYFLQVREDGSLLPPLASFAISSGLLPEGSKCETARTPSASAGEDDCNLTIGKLFYEFTDFYCKHFDWRNEAVSVRLGRRAPPDARLPIHVVLDASGKQSQNALAIEDPFDPKSNLSTLMNAMSMERLRQELSRAVELCERGASLTSLLAPWAPSEVEEAMERQGSSSDKEE
jgi:DNA polymerase sigma